jgi:hypothetical protein
MLLTRTTRQNKRKMNFSIITNNKKQHIYYIHKMKIGNKILYINHSSLAVNNVVVSLFSSLGKSNVLRS